MLAKMASKRERKTSSVWFTSNFSNQNMFQEILSNWFLNFFKLQNLFKLRIYQSNLETKNAVFRKYWQFSVHLWNILWSQKLIVAPKIDIWHLSNLYCLKKTAENFQSSSSTNEVTKTDGAWQKVSQHSCVRDIFGGG